MRVWHQWAVGWPTVSGGSSSTALSSPLMVIAWSSRHLHNGFAHGLQGRHLALQRSTRLSISFPKAWTSPSTTGSSMTSSTPSPPAQQDQYQVFQPPPQGPRGVLVIGVQKTDVGLVMPVVVLGSPSFSTGSIGALAHSVTSEGGGTNQVTDRAAAATVWRSPKRRALHRA